ncbi:MAG TPA: hypothetical protein VID95_07585 [Candidatus Limnocylindrales bacterium]
MHEDLIERRLRDALRSEGDGLAFTITPAELERRLNLRRRRHALRPTSLLLAAAVGIGLVGVASLVGGWFERQPDPTPGPSALAILTPTSSAQPVNVPPASALPPVDLPTIEDLIHAGPVGDIVLAQANGPGSIVALPDVPVAHASSLELGPVADGPYRMEFGCLAPDGSAAVATFALVPVGAAPGDPTNPVACDGRMTSSMISADGRSVLRLALPGSASWRLIVRALNGGPAAPPSSATEPIAPPGAEVLIDTSSSAAHPKPGASQASDAIGPPIDVGQIKFRDRYQFRASCAGSPAIAYHVGFSDPKSPFVPDSTTLVPCDGAIHDMTWRPGDRPNPDVFVTAPEGSSWRLLLSADPAPIVTTPDEGGWTSAMSSGPRFVADDLNESLVGRLTGKNTIARVVVSCQGGTSVDVSVSRGDQTGSLQTFTAPCSDGAATTVGEPFIPDANGGYTVDVNPHGRMWTAVTVQQAPASAAR